MAFHSSVLAWRIPGKGEPGGLPCMGLPHSSTSGLSLLEQLESQAEFHSSTQDEA